MNVTINCHRFYFLLLIHHIIANEHYFLLSQITLLTNELHVYVTSNKSYLFAATKVLHLQMKQMSYVVLRMNPPNQPLT